MAALTIHEAASTTGWSPRMLRYVEQLGLVVPPRSPSGYRLYGPAQLTRLRSLRALIDEHGVELGDVGFALRLKREAALAAALDTWFDTPALLTSPEVADADWHDPDRHDSDGHDSDWLAFEQDKHAHLLSRQEH